MSPAVDKSQEAQKMEMIPNKKGNQNETTKTTKNQKDDKTVQKNQEATVSGGVVSASKEEESKAE